MSTFHVLVGNGRTTAIEQVAIECPFCHSKMIPDYLFLHKDRLFAACSNSSCGKHMVLSSNMFSEFIFVDPNSRPNSLSFSDTITSISPSFEIIYNQAYCAEQLSLDQVCGVGYRKALEFLIKDYLICGVNDVVAIDAIKNKFLSKCIQEDVSDLRIKEVAKRAVWLGNDETHYIRKWADKDVSNLKQLINLTIRWIENEVETKTLLEEMPEYQTTSNL